MWRNGSGHRAVRSSGPRAHASRDDNAKKSAKACATLTSSILEAQASQVDTGVKKAEMKKAMLKARQDAEEKLLLKNILDPIRLQKQKEEQAKVQQEIEEKAQQDKEEKRRLIRMEVEKKVAALKAEQEAEEGK